MKKDDVIVRPEEVKSTLEELEMLATLADSNEFVILKRVARRFAEQYKELSFRLDENDLAFKKKHTSYYERAAGMHLLLRFVEEARRKVAKAEGDVVSPERS